jgi:tetratricopeptide (TPR) repeat protein
VPDGRWELGRTCAGLAQLHRQAGRLDLAESVCERGVQVVTKLAADFPEERDYQRLLGRCYQEQGMVHEARGRLPQAEAVYRQIVPLRRRLAEALPDDAVVHAALAVTLHQLAKVVNQRGNLREAQQLLEEAIQQERRALDITPQHLQVRLCLRNHYISLAMNCLQQGEHAEAARTALELPRLYPDGWQEHARAARDLARCIEVVRKDGRLTPEAQEQLARSYGDQAMVLLRQALQNAKAKGHKDPGSLLRSKTLEPLRSRADFQQLAAEEEALKKP